jgi:hypothetical protein
VYNNVVAWFVFHSFSLSQRSFIPFACGAVCIAFYCMIWYVGQKALDLYRQLPQNFLEFGIGLIFCFFGGVYPTLFAAVQAAENGGRTAVLDSLYDLAQEATVIVEESKKDDNADDDKDGKKDVTEASNKEYWQRKTLLVLRKMNPEKVGRTQIVIAIQHHDSCV